MKTERFDKPSISCKFSKQVEYVDVYRIEKRGRGPFRYYDSDEGWRLESALELNHPTPTFDKGIDRGWMENSFDMSKHRFGCPTPQSLKSWVKKPVVLDKLGFRVVHYYAKKKYTHSSEIQIMFIKRHSKRVMEWDVETFMKEN